VGRPRRQEPKRALLVAAAQRVLVRNGLVGLRVRDVAAEAQVSPGSVIYYYPDSFQLAVEALALAIKARSSERAAVAASVPHPARRVAALVAMSLPDPNPGIERALLEAVMLVGEHPELRPLLAEMVDGHVQVFAEAIADGVASGVFPVGLPPEQVARSLVANLHAAQGYSSAALQTPEQTRGWVVAALEQSLGAGLPEAQQVDLDRVASAPFTPPGIPVRSH